MRLESAKARIAFVPRTRAGGVHHLQRLTSRIEYRAEKINKLTPPLNSAKVLVHSFLLIGSSGCSSQPASARISPAAASAKAVRLVEYSVRNHSPAITPIKSDAIAGNVESRPSGSKVTP